MHNYVRGPNSFSECLKACKNWWRQKLAAMQGIMSWGLQSFLWNYIQKEEHHSRTIKWKRRISKAINTRVKWIKHVAQSWDVLTQFINWELRDLGHLDESKRSIKYSIPIFQVYWVLLIMQNSSPCRRNIAIIWRK